MIVKCWGRDGHYNKFECDNWVEDMNVNCILLRDIIEKDNGKQGYKIKAILNMDNLFDVVFEDGEN